MHMQRPPQRLLTPVQHSWSSCIVAAEDAAGDCHRTLQGNASSVDLCWHRHSQLLSLPAVLRLSSAWFDKHWERPGVYRIPWSWSDCREPDVLLGHVEGD